MANLEHAAAVTRMQAYIEEKFRGRDYPACVGPASRVFTVALRQNV